MKALEFKARTEKGVIKIPKEFRNELDKEVRVIILLEDKETVRSNTPEFTAVKIKTKGFKFSREEANER
ncbi:hypothetical protein JXL19_11930 [bacterium]|nr:hypothetical protein [bacterium]